MTRCKAWLAVLLVGFSVNDSYAGGGICPNCAPATGSAQREILGPCDMPHRLRGTWKITMCIQVNCSDTGHTWLRYQNVETGEVHTVGRYMKGHGAARGVDSGELIYPPAPQSGVIYDLDLKRESRIRAGKIYTISCVANDPIVFRGENNGFRHGGHKNNCVTHVRDGWRHFTGESYELGCLAHTPGELLDEVACRHPEILRGH